jgi:hypothetical protein
VPTECSQLALINGGFEIPNNIVWIGSQASDAGSTDSIPGIGWHTTEPDHIIEFWPSILSPGDGYAFTWGDAGPAHEGKNFVELQANSPGALYQDIKTQPGTSIIWSLAHKGREHFDSMSVRIGNARDATDDFETHGGGGLVQQGDLITDGPSSWGIHSGTYVVPDGQTLTRFWFEAVDNGGSISSVGNFLDDISFAPQGCISPTPTFSIPTPNSNGFSVQITNYDPSNFAWLATSTSGTVSISNSGILTVETSPGQSSTVTVKTSRSNFLDGSASLTGSSLGSALIPRLSSPVGTDDGFTMNVTNFDPSFTWSTPSISRGSLSIVSTSGSIRTLAVSGLSPGESSTISLNTSKAGYLPGSALITGTARTLYPNLISYRSTSDGFTSQITNFSNLYSWTGTATAGGTVNIDASGGVTVTNLPPLTTSTVTITASRTGYTSGSGQITGRSAALQYILTYSAGTHGSITGPSTQTVDSGSSGSEVNAVADSGFHFVNWSDGLTTNPRIDTDVSGTISVTANFTENVAPITHGVVPSIVNQTVAAAPGILGANFTLGVATGTTAVGATALNDGQIASQSLTGDQPYGSTINYTTYAYVAPITYGVVPSIVNQTDLVTSCAVASGSTLGGNTYLMSGTFTASVIEIEVGEIMLPKSAWVQNATSVAITMPPHAAGKVAIQVYNSLSPALTPCSYTYLTPSASLDATHRLKVFFRVGSKTITKSQKLKLESFAKKISSLGRTITVTITGDSRNKKNHDALSKSRKTAVAALLKKAGVNSTLIDRGTERAESGIALSRYVVIVYP